MAIRFIAQEKEIEYQCKNCKARLAYLLTDLSEWRKAYSNDNHYKIHYWLIKTLECVSCKSNQVIQEQEITEHQYYKVELQEVIAFYALTPNS